MVESAVDELWQDQARRSFRARILTPLDIAEGRAQQNLQDLDAALGRALAQLRD